VIWIEKNSRNIPIIDEKSNDIETADKVKEVI
jgi:uncharacterized protein YnzC (UPF0291/DUF896 family)